MPWKHVSNLIGGIRTDIPPSMLNPSFSPYIKGCILKDGEIRSEGGTVEFPTAGDTKSNALNGSVMAIKQFSEFSALSYLLALTTTNIYEYNTTTDTWDCITNGVEIDDCEAAWDASADVTSTADASVKLRDDKSAKHVIASDFTTGIVSSEGNLQNTDISAAANTYLSFWIRSSGALSSDVLRLRLSEQATGGTGATWAEYTIPALVANAWQHICLDITDTADDNGGTYPDDFNSLASVALIAESDPGAVTIYLDDIRTTQSFTGDEDNRFSVTTMIDTFVFTNGVDLPRKVTAAGGALTVAILPTNLATGAITNAEVVLTFKDHLLLINNIENAANAPQRLSWSNIGTIDEWITGTAGYIDLVDSEEDLVAAELLNNNEVAIYKENSIISMVWVGGHTPFRFRTVLKNAGALSKDSVFPVQSSHLVADANKVYVYHGGSSFKELDDYISVSMYNALDRSYINRVFVTHINELNEVQVWIPTGTAYPDDVWCINSETTGWYRRSKTMMCQGEYYAQSTLTIGELIGTIGDQNWRFGDTLTKTNTPITLMGDHNGKVYQLSAFSYSNNGVAIVNDYQTSDITIPVEQNSYYIDKFMRVSLLVIEAKGTAVTITYSTDGGATWSPTQGRGTNVITLDSIYRTYQQDFDATVRKIRFRFYNSDINGNFQIQYFGFKWIPRSERR